MSEPTILWKPSEERIKQSALVQFWKTAEAHSRKKFFSYDELHRWSVQNYRDFWTLWLRESKLIAEGSASTVVEPPSMPDSHFFPRLKLNFAENLLRFDDHHTALVGLSEARAPVKLTYHQLKQLVARLSESMRAGGIRPGDRIAAMMPNTCETVIAMLAATSIGAVWSSCSPEFGVQGVVDRFGQIEPRWFFAPNAYQYNGKIFDCLEKIKHITDQIPSIEKIVLVPLAQAHPAKLDGTKSKCEMWDEQFLSEDSQLHCERLPFNHPVYILYSSGTTGKPKCIVHGAGGTLLQHTKELILHSDLNRSSNITYYTTCGWMMWNWLVSSLYTGCTVTLYDGSPSYPDLEAMWKLADEQKLTHFGTSARFISSCRIQGAAHKKFPLTNLQTILSTGSPLLPEDFDWIYENIKSDVLLSSISGGTDIISCFMLGTPVLPVFRGEIQCMGLGMDVAALDEKNTPVFRQKGELVCRTPFPSMPVSFWNDPNNEKYKKAYFHRDPAIWFHGDYVEITQSQGNCGGIVVYGRSDATLNPGGVRIGTAEIYRLVETLPEISDSLVIGQPWKGDVRVILFVKLADSYTLTPELIQKIKTTLKAGASPRHVPDKILSVRGVPYTLSGKKVELAVLEIISGKEPKNKEALADVSVLDDYRSLRNQLDV